MIATLVGLVVGAAVAVGLWTTTHDSFAVPALARTNYRGAPLATGVGVLVPVAVVLVVAASYLVEVAGDRPSAWIVLLPTVATATVGFGLLGLLDDVLGVGQSGGFRGHLRGVAGGHLTSGAVKLLGGAALGIVVAAGVRPADEVVSVLSLLRDGAVVALAANLANLFDRAPGRVIKVTTAGFVVAAIVARTSVMFGPAVAVGAGLGLLPPDLRERVMLGDAGSNPLGAVCGLAALVAVPASAWRWVLLLALLALNLLSEVVSFSVVIDRVPPLRWLDRAGSLRDA